MAPIVRCDFALLNTLEEDFVVHDNLEGGGGTLVRSIPSEADLAKSREKRLEEIHRGGGGAAHIPHVLAKADLCQHILAVSDLADRGESRGKLADAKTSGQRKLTKGKHTQARLAKTQQYSHAGLSNVNHPARGLTDRDDPQRQASDRNDALGDDSFACFRAFAARVVQ